MNENWVRWITSSMIFSFTEALKTDLTVHVEGINRATDTKDQWVEIRWDGPISIEKTKDEWSFELIVNIIVHTIQDDKDFYKHEKALGKVTAAFVNSIDVMEYNEDPLVQFGCLQLDNNGVDVSRFGIIDADLNIVESSVQGTYRMSL